MSDLFISYSRDDRTFVERLHAAVKASGRNAWLDKFDIEKGAKFWQEIERGIDGANAFVFVISPTSIQKAAGEEEYCRLEIEYAVRQGKRIIPIIWRDRFQPDERVENWLDKEIPAHRELMERAWIKIRDREFGVCFTVLINTYKKDLDYLKLHTKLLEASLDWIREGRKDSDLIRGESLSNAETWLKLGEQKVHLQSEKAGRKHPDSEPTEDHRNFIHQSRLAEDSRLRRETLMRRAIIWGGGILAISLMGAGIATSGAMRASKLRQEAEIGTRLEQAGAKALEQFKEQQTEGLLTAMRNVVELKTLVQDGRPIEEYPTVTPLLALQMNLDNLQEYPLKGHQGSVEAMQFSPDGRTIATAGKDSTTIIWNLIGKKLSQLSGHQGAVRVLKYSPNSKTIATGGEDGTTRLWDLDGKELIQLKGPKVNITAIQFNPDGKTIATGGEDGIVRVWDFNGKELLQFKAHHHNTIEIQFSHDGKKIITQGQNILSVTTARLWDLNGKALNKFEIPTEEIATKAENVTLKSIKFSPDGKTIVTGIAGGSLRLWDVESNTLKQSKTLDLGRSVSLEFSPNGKSILCSGGHNMYLWNLEEKESTAIQFTVPMGESITDGKFSSDGKNIITGGANGGTQVWDLTGKELNRIKSDVRYIRDAKFGHNRSTIATLGKDGTARLWDLSGQEFTTFKGEITYVRDVNFIPDTKTIATREDSSSMNFRLWDFNGVELNKLKDLDSPISEAKFSPDGRLVATVGRKGVQVWDLNSSQLRQVREDPYVRDVEFSPNGKTIVIHGAVIVTLWDLDYNQFINLKHYTGYGEVRFSPTGQIIATNGYDFITRLWDLSGKELMQLKGHQTHLWDIQFSSDGKIIMTHGQDGTIWLWDLEGKNLAQLKGHIGNVHKVRFNPDGKTIATGGEDGTARLWDLNGKELKQLRGHQGSVNNVQFSPNGKTLLTSGDDDSTRVWDMAGRQIARFKGKGYPTPDWKEIVLVTSMPNSNNVITTIRPFSILPSDLLAIGCDRLKTYLLQSPELKDDRKMCGLE